MPDRNAVQDAPASGGLDAPLPDHPVLKPLTLDFLRWLDAKPRDYVEVMDAWRTSCPRLTVWEDAIDAGLITRRHVRGQSAIIALTPAGKALLAAHGG